MDPAALLGAFDDLPVHDPIKDRQQRAKTQIYETQAQQAQEQLANEQATRAALLKSDEAEQQNVILAAALAEKLPTDATGKATGLWKSSSGSIFRIEDFSDRIKIFNLSKPEITYDARRLGDLLLVDLYASGERFQHAMRQRDSDHLLVTNLKYGVKDSTAAIERKAAKALTKAGILWIKMN